jgi:hypothetical protein
MTRGATIVHPWDGAASANAKIPHAVALEAGELQVADGLEGEPDQHERRADRVEPSEGAGCTGSRTAVTRSGLDT